MKSRHYKYRIGRFQQPDSVNGTTFSPSSWNLYTYVNNNPLNFTDPFGLRQAWATVPSGSDTPELSTENECPTACPFDGKKCDCPGDSCDIDPSTGIYICGSETVEVIGKPIGGLSDEDIKKYLPDEFFEEFNLIPFEVWAAQNSMNKPPKAFNRIKYGEATNQPYIKRWWKNFKTTNEFLPGSLAPWGTTFITTNAFSKAAEMPTPFQWAKAGFKGLKAGGIQFNSLGTGTLVGYGIVANWFLVGVSYEVGVAIGSGINALIFPNLDY